MLKPWKTTDNLLNSVFVLRCEVRQCKSINDHFTLTMNVTESLFSHVSTNLPRLALLRSQKYGLNSSIVNSSFFQVLE